MADLEPTTARLAVLRAVADPATIVRCSHKRGRRVSWQIDNHDATTRRNVSYRCNELAHAGWIRAPGDIHRDLARPWHITALGERILRQHDHDDAP